MPTPKRQRTPSSAQKAAPKRAKKASTESGSDEDEQDQEQGQDFHEATAQGSTLLTRPQLEKVYHLPSKDAAKALGVTLTRLKKECRKLGVPRWPHRKLQSLEQLKLEVEKEHTIKGKDKEAILARVLTELEAVRANPEHDIDPELDHVRQVKYKLRYYHKNKHYQRAAVAHKKDLERKRLEEEAAAGRGGALIPALTAANPADPSLPNDYATSLLLARSDAPSPIALALQMPQLSPADGLLHGTAVANVSGNEQLLLTYNQLQLNSLLRSGGGGRISPFHGNQPDLGLSDDLQRNGLGRALAISSLQAGQIAPDSALRLSLTNQPESSLRLGPNASDSDRLDPSLPGTNSLLDSLGFGRFGNNSLSTLADALSGGLQSNDSLLLQPGFSLLLNPINSNQVRAGTSFLDGPSSRVVYDELSLQEAPPLDLSKAPFQNVRRSSTGEHRASMAGNGLPEALIHPNDSEMRGSSTGERWRSTGRPSLGGNMNTDLLEQQLNAGGEMFRPVPLRAVPRNSGAQQRSNTYDLLPGGSLLEDLRRQQQQQERAELQQQFHRTSNGGGMSANQHDHQHQQQHVLQQQFNRTSNAGNMAGSSMSNLTSSNVDAIVQQLRDESRAVATSGPLPVLTGSQGDLMAILQGTTSLDMLIAGRTNRLMEGSKDPSPLPSRVPTPQPAPVLQAVDAQH